ncbi:uncharacterized protein RCC_02524 [Ramularia collo-cygni]|uniref:J domain-containing protein n=1 Tax=Ramularia collo-cygni TaxID=112498 RepID=A0A2D3V5C8_9PEZI|nr:uncharacterized protein RCC_02524 [Ramularia collo-cygni]CZT16689.1 uncharacterized protein RCC_02524 [Ramularia collo-cygni]
MDLPPDPYLALGLPKDATQAAVKTAHRKLVLKCHPDKVTDPAAKQAAADQFHKIQTAYEILIDEDRRGRYDAQVRLASLRKDAMERPGAGAARPSYKSSHEPSARPAYASRASERMPPQYEERRPSYAAADYFDARPRPSPARKEPEYERPSKRSEAKEKPRTSTRDAKESERERRKEKTRKTDRETRKDRETKYTPRVDDDSESDSDEYARRSGRMREEEAMRKARQAHYEEVYRHRKESAAEPHDVYTRKMDDARDYIQSSRVRPRTEPPMEDAPRSRARADPREEAERRPSAARMASTKDKVEYVKGRDGRPAVVVRRTSERPKSKDVEPPRAEYSHRREPERRSSAEKLADRRPPMLNTSKSSPSDIRMPAMEKQRAQSMQVEAEPAPRVSPVKRSETMPYGVPRAAENAPPTKGSHLRQTEFSEGLATPATTPDHATPPANKYNYSRQYADDAEYPTPDGYRTELREPGSKSRPTVPHRVTRSPSPIKESRDVREQREERSRDPSSRDGRSARTSSARQPSAPQPAMPPRTTSYMYSGPGQGVEAYDRASRPAMPRGESMRSEVPTREGLYYGEVPTTKNGVPPRHRSAAVDEGIRYAKKPKPEDIKVQSGYSSVGRRAPERPMYTRSGSGYGVKA